MDGVQRDSDYRIAALTNAVNRAAQDGGLSGEFDVLGLANVYYDWLTGNTGLKDPIYEQAQKKKKS